MKGKRLSGWKPIPHLFSKIIVGYCILFMSWQIEDAMRIAEETGTITDSILQVALAFFGGELMLICMRDIFTKKKKEEPKDD